MPQSFLGPATGKTSVPSRHAGLVVSLDGIPEAPPWMSRAGLYTGSDT